MTQQITDFIAVSDKHGDLAGASTWFQLGGGVVARELRQAGVAAGIDEALMPADPTPKAAIRRAVSEQKCKRIAIDNVKQGTWTVSRNTGRQQSGDAASLVVLSVTLGAGDVLSFDHDGSDEAKAMERKIETAYQGYLTTLDASDLSAWLVSTAARLRAVPLRERGGVYFVPRGSLAEWRRTSEALKAVAPECDVYELPTLRSGEAVRSIVAALAREAAQEAQAIYEQIDNGVGARGLKARQADCDALLSKLSEYETLLGTSLQSVKTQIDDVSAAAGVAAVMADSSAASGNPAMMGAAAGF